VYLKYTYECYNHTHTCWNRNRVCGITCACPNYTLRVIITLVRVIITLVRVEITLYVWKSHFTCGNHTLRVKILVRIEITLCVCKLHSYVLKSHLSVCSENWAFFYSNNWINFFLDFTFYLRSTSFYLLGLKCPWGESAPWVKVLMVVNCILLDLKIYFVGLKISD
jgi:hypothetical protein